MSVLDHFEYNPEAPGMTGPPRQPFWLGPPPVRPQGTQPPTSFPSFPLPPQNPSIQARNREHLISIPVKDDKGKNPIEIYQMKFPYMEEVLYYFTLLSEFHQCQGVFLLVNTNSTPPNWHE